MTENNNTAEQIANLKSLISDSKNTVTDQKIAQAEMRSTISDLNSALIRNVSQSNALEMSQLNNQNRVDSLEKELAKTNEMFLFIKRQLYRVIGIFALIIVSVIVLIAAVVINGKIVHYETGLDERDNQVFNSENTVDLNQQ